MQKRIGIGKQDFAALMENQCFYIDKTDLIRQWWDSGDDVTLITRPRRFGKTLNMSMLNCFFSNQYAGRSDLFEGLSVWNHEEYRQIQGTYPVLFLSFASVKADNAADAKKQIKSRITSLYQDHEYLLEDEALNESEKLAYRRLLTEMINMDDITACDSLNHLCKYLTHVCGKKPVILLDEYDTPMQESYVYGYWEELTSFLRNLFNATFKTNTCLERAIMTGITRVSKESMFSDLNNLNVVTTTSDQYAACFGFTKEEVSAALAAFWMEDKEEEVKRWYNGFTFGSQKDIYNPWSITNYLDKKELRPYWASTSSNGLVNKLLQTASGEMKTMLESLLEGNRITVNLDEQLAFNQLGQNENAVWSLLLAGGYLKAEHVEYRGITREPWYTLSVTNLETISMFSNMFKGWFERSLSNYNGFLKALLKDDVEAMNYYMNKVAMATFSYFDVGGGRVEDSEPERFYHGFVLGLMADQADVYEIRSNRESGFGRYDVMMIPRKMDDVTLPAIILEFKVHNSRREKNLEETVEAALAQIETKNYDAELLALGIGKEKIRHYGFAFEGKKILIG
ncbi:MAG: AAA family ATPase [Lachnospiraceae bacterium]|nr:AAA family ATPase [Lachnospiraceae bacterium]